MVEREHPKTSAMWKKLADAYAKAHDGQVASTRDEIVAFVHERFKALDNNLFATGNELGVSTISLRKFIPEDEILSQPEATRRAMRRIYDDPQKRTEFLTHHLQSPEARRNRSAALRGVNKGKRLPPHAYEKARKTIQAKGEATRQRVTNFSHQSPFPDVIAEEAGMNPGTVSNLLRKLHLQHLHHAKTSSILKRGRNLAQEIGLEDHLDQMDERMRYIAQQRLLTPKPLEMRTIAQILFENGLTKSILTGERVRQIEKVLIDRMQRLVDAGYTRRDSINGE